MIYATPKSIFSWGFDVYHNGRILAEIDTSWLIEGGSMEHDGITYRLEKEGFMSGNFTLRDSESVIATAQKTPLMRCFDIDYDGCNYTLKAASLFSRQFLVRKNGNTIGRISPKHPFTRRCMVDMPSDIPIPLQLFTFWLATLMWRRSQQKTAAC